MTPEIENLKAQLVDLQQRKEALRAEALPIIEEIKSLSQQVFEAEQAEGDRLAEENIRERGGVQGALAARGIAATLSDPERKARFEALAAELAG